MNTLEQIQSIRNMNVIEDTLYEYNQTERNQAMVSSIGRVLVVDLTRSETEELGWPTWSDDCPMVMIPFYLYDYLEFGQKITCIDGDEITVSPGYDNPKSGNDIYIDNDHRGGYLAYGFYPKKG